MVLKLGLSEELLLITAWQTSGLVHIYAVLFPYTQPRWFWQPEFRVPYIHTQQNIILAFVGGGRCQHSIIVHMYKIDWVFSEPSVNGILSHQKRYIFLCIYIIFHWFSFELLQFPLFSDGSGCKCHLTEIFPLTVCRTLTQVKYFMHMDLNL